MALTVQTNNAAMTALKNLNANNQAMSNSLERLSSGFRINNAADDASGFAVSSKLDAQTERLKAASQNASNAKSMVKMADAGVNEIQNMVVRIQTLAIQASSANAAGELGKLDAERIKLEGAIDKIAGSTNYNGVNLLNGTAGNAAGAGFNSTFTAGGAVANVANATVTTASTTNANASYGIGTDANGGVFLTTAGTGTQVSGTAAFAANGSVSLTAIDGAVVKVDFGATSPTANKSGAAGANNVGVVAASGQEKYAQGAGANKAAVSAVFKTTSSTMQGQDLVIKQTSLAKVDGSDFAISFSRGGTVLGSAVVSGAANATSTFDVALSDGSVVTLSDTITASLASGAIGNTLGTLSAAVGGGGSGKLSFQVGADSNASNQVEVDLSNDYSSASLGLGAVGALTTQAGAQAYIDTAKAALDTVVKNRADLGATQNQVSFIQANLASSIEQTTASVSTIRDADMAAEMAEFTKNQILTQASTAMLAQANQAAQNVMSLFR